MTPSRWLYITALATATGLSVGTPHAPLAGRVLCVLSLILALARWRCRLHAWLWSACIIGAFASYVYGAVPWQPPQPHWIVRSREVFVHALSRAMPDREAQLGAGMLLGITEGMSAAVHAEFRTAGVTHLVAVSGANLSLILAAFTTTGVLVRSRRAILALTLILAPTFALFTNVEPSILRAATMAVLGAVVVACGRRAAPVNLLLAASLLVLLLDPTLLWGSVGFQLSVAATFGLVTLSMPLTSALVRLRVPGRVLLAPTLAASCTTTPIILLVFGRASLVSVFANLAIGPLVPLVMILTALTGGATLVLPAAGAVLGIPGWAVLRAVGWLASTAAHFPAASVTLPAPVAVVAAAILGLAAVLLIIRYAPRSFA